MFGSWSGIVVLVITLAVGLTWLGDQLGQTSWQERLGDRLNKLFRKD